ncbi:hypothetical protein SARC_08158 [Sphaeroforma arctica JP610]|uniref:Uncharacterized protein n=1 Tax=Sphaeroforma arctica JP610 TaxID=667725 RepID=A0A0L0FU42_9EUKA|nr:hypothetical protein SARC_08158 [Sphaeroforma arctica JP610]KNC79448.1 hypothetical protein SARC_08158 [Sphaeroforma arctica JP610]|eukprot:XP_014153350.1 hypothetical protein SARC_08158 [Sphaeroforma arctica JP610]
MNACRKSWIDTEAAITVSSDYGVQQDDIYVPESMRQCVQIDSKFILATNDDSLSCVADNDGHQCRTYSS